jgi:hypothetical protein
MKNFIFIIALLFSSTVASAQTFYERSSKFWTVYGDQDALNGNPGCWMQYNWQDGSSVQIGYDMGTQTMNIYFKNMNWQIVDQVNQVYEGLRINFFSSDGSVVGGNFSYLLIDKNSLLIPEVNIKPFLDAFSNRKQMVFVMPGTIENAHIDLTGTRQAVQYFTDCLSRVPASDRSNKNQPKEGDESVHLIKWL